MIPKYCKLCGAELEKRTVNNTQRGYDENTGKPKMVNVTFLRCPNEQGSFTEFDGHDVLEIIEDLDTN